MKYLILAFILLFSLSSFADYRIISNPKVVKLNGVWKHVSTQYGNWIEVGDLINCSNIWTPESNTITYGQTFNQYQVCNQKEERTVTAIEEFSLNNKIREVEQNKEYRVVNKEKVRSNIGTKSITECLYQIADRSKTSIIQFYKQTTSSTSYSLKWMISHEPGVPSPSDSLSKSLYVLPTENNYFYHNGYGYWAGRVFANGSYSTNYEICRRKVSQ